MRYADASPGRKATFDGCAGGAFCEGRERDESFETAPAAIIGGGDWVLDCPSDCIGLPGCWFRYDDAAAGINATLPLSGTAGLCDGIERFEESEGTAAAATTPGARPAAADGPAEGPAFGPVDGPADGPGIGLLLLRFSHSDAPAAKNAISAVLPEL